MLTGLPQVHYQMLFSHLVALSVLARQKIKIYPPLPGQLGSFPRLCLHNSSKSSYGMPFHPQCDSWFWHWHIVGSDEPSLASLELLQGVVLRLFGMARSSSYIEWGGMSLMFLFMHAHTYTSHLLLGKGCLGCGCCLALRHMQLHGAVPEWLASAINWFRCVIYPRKAPLIIL